MVGKEVLEPGFTALILFLLTSRILLSRLPSPGAYTLTIAMISHFLSFNITEKKKSKIADAERQPFWENGPCHIMPVCKDFVKALILTGYVSRK